MEVACVRVDSDLRNVVTRVPSYAMWISRRTLLSTAHSHAHDCNLTVDTYVLEFAVTFVADAKYLSARLFYRAVMRTITLDALRPRRGQN